MSEELQQQQSEEQHKVVVSQIQYFVATRIKEYGFPYEIEPGESYPVDSPYKNLPLDLTTLKHTELGSHLGYWTAWANKARRLATFADTEYTNRARLHRLYFSEAMTKIPSYHFEDVVDANDLVKPSKRKRIDRTSTDKKHHAELQKKVINAEFERDKAKALYDYLRALFEEYTANYNAVSREIARREKLL